MNQIRYLWPLLFALALLGITSGSALGFQRPPPKLIKNRPFLVHVEGEKLIVKIKTRSNPQRYLCYSGVNLGMDTFSIDRVTHVSSPYIDARIPYVSKQYAQDGMFVIELSLPYITASYPRFNWIAVVLHKGGSRGEEYLYKLDKPIYEELERPYYPTDDTTMNTRKAYRPIVRVEKEKIIIKVYTRLELERYNKGVYGIHFYYLFSNRGIYLTGADVSKQYTQDDMFVIEIDKQMVNRELTKCTSINIALINGEKKEYYFYIAQSEISLVEE